MEKKWIVVAAKVWSASDNQTHKITAQQLCKLYNVNPEECILVDMERPQTMVGLPNLPRLYPDYSGQYKLPQT